MDLAEIFALVAIILAAVALVLLVILLRRGSASAEAGLAELRQQLEAVERGLRDESARQTGALRQDMNAALRGFNDSVLQQMTGLGGLQRQHLEGFSGQIGRLTESNERKLDDLRITLETQLTQIQDRNAAKLEEMRLTVDEKLQTTLERRLGESFQIVSDRLEQVHKGLGEMQTLASGVGDLKKVLTNIKVRGTWGEMQLGNLLEQVLIPEQYDRNVATKADSADRVEFAIRLPGRDDADGEAVWLPIDAKFPKEDYERLVDASERGDPAAVEAASRDLETRVKAMAKDIRDKYLDPPHTTDFGILYLSTEGLYAEVLRRPGLVAGLQRDFRVNVAGPTTLAALLNSLQMGFRTLAIQKRSSEVWRLLGAVKTEFGRFGDVIDRVQKKIQEAGDQIEKTKVRSRAIERKLKNVEGLPAGEVQVLLEAAETDAESASGEDEDAGRNENGA
jgi:DNA recombination protein RmuC